MIKSLCANIINYLPQQPYVFNGTILENLLLGAKEGTTREDILRAVELAEIREDIERMPLNYQTELTSDGTGISGGQRQRIALARALLTDAPILILDEATSSLDILTEKRIVDNLMNLDKTLIFIAHRLTIAERVEKVVVLDRGKIVEEGNHADLLVQNSFYTHLVNCLEGEIMHLDFLESAEFYNRRYHNFSSRVIFPMSLLVVFYVWDLQCLQKRKLVYLRKLQLNLVVSLLISNQLVIGGW